MTDLLELIKTRRTVKPAAMNGTILDDSAILKCLEAAHWAPTHGRTEPWRFFVYSGEALARVCTDHAEMYRSAAGPENFMVSKYDSLKNMSHTVSHLVVVGMQRTPMTKIPFLEEYAAVSAAVQNILLMAHSLGIAAIWSTGGMALKPEMKAYLGLQQQEDEVVGFIYLGKTDKEDIPATRKTPVADKIHWTK